MTNGYHVSGKRGGKRPPHDGASWTAGELKTLKSLAKAGTTLCETAFERIGSVRRSWTVT